MKHWLLGCLNSGIKRAAEMAGTFLTAYVVGVPLDWKLLTISWGVGFIIGVLVYQASNPIPENDDTVTTIRVQPDSLKPTEQDK